MVLMLLAALVPLTATTAQASPETDGYCRGAIRSGIDLFLDHRQVGQRLQRIERDSAGRVEVDVAGQSFQGRNIWTARVGHGDQVIVLESEIHGNEKHATIAVLDVLERVAADTDHAAAIREAVTLVVIPILNPDGSELDIRRNGMTWEQTLTLHPQLEGAPPAWYYNANQGGFDINRDFNPDLDYVPDPDDLPGVGSGVSFFLTPESQAARDVYRDLEDEFGTVHYWVGLHNQGPCYRWGTQDQIEDPRLSYLSISSEFVAADRVDEWPDLDLAQSRRANLAVNDALQFGGGLHPMSRITRYPPVDLPGSGLGAFALRGTAVVLLETSGQTQHIGHHRINLFVKQVDAGLMGLIDSVTDGSVEDLDPDRFFEIPTRAGWSW
jgi:hypothetical protein